MLPRLCALSTIENRFDLNTCWQQILLAVLGFGDAVLEDTFKYEIFRELMDQVEKGTE